MQTPSKTASPKGQFLLGNLLEFKRDPLAFMIAWQRDFGDLAHFKLGPRDFYLFSHPGLVEQALQHNQDSFIKIYDAQKPNDLALVLGQGLITSTGDLWRKQRRLIQPVFHRANVANMLPEMVAACLKVLKRWDQLPDNTVVDIADEALSLTIEVITQTMFGISVLEEIDKIVPALEICLRYVAKTVMSPLRLPLFVPTPANRQFIQARRQLDDFIYGIIQQRRAGSAKYNDLLQMLIDAEDPGTGEKMPDRQIRDEVLTVYSAGHETTANTLTWTLALLASHPETMVNLKNELHSTLNGKIPDTNDLSRLTYAKAVLEESLRIRPPVGATMRKISKDIRMQGRLLKAGSYAVFCIYNLHHHADFWEQPEIFNPDRFLASHQRNQAYMPFGIGHRFCIGNHFALTEAQLSLAMLLQKYDFHLLSDKMPEMELVVMIKPKGGLPMRISRAK